MKQLAILLAFLLAVLLMMTGVMAVGNARQSEQMAERAMQLSSTRAELRKVKKEKASLTEALDKSRSQAEALLRERQAVARRLTNGLLLLEAAEGGSGQAVPGMAELLPAAGSGEVLLQATALEQALGRQAQAASAAQQPGRHAQAGSAAQEPGRQAQAVSAAQQPGGQAQAASAAQEPGGTAGAICWALVEKQTSDEASGDPAHPGNDAAPGSTYTGSSPAQEAPPAGAAQGSPANGNAGTGATPLAADSEKAAPEALQPAAVLAVSEAIELPVAIRPQPESRLTLLLGALREQAAQLEQLLSRLAELLQNLTAPIAGQAQ